MAIIEILHYPDPRLRTKAIPVTQTDETIQKLVDDMLETMYAAPGIGLAATQVNTHKRMFVLDISEDNNDPMCFINPKILSSSGTESMEEGCLSVPGIYESVERAEHITVEALDQEGKSFSLDADGLLAICIQHEIDHLNGKLFVDYLSTLKQQRVRKKLEKQQRKNL